MRTRLSLLVVGMVVAMVVLNITPEAQGSDRSDWLDQVNDPGWTGGWTHISAEADLAASQTFVPTRPRLMGTEVALLTANPLHVGRGVTVRVLDSDGVTVASSSQALASGFEGWLFFKFGERGVPVEPGMTYTLQVVGDGCCLFGWKYAGDTYPDGERIIFGVPRDGTDWLFRTYAR